MKISCATTMEILESHPLDWSSVIHDSFSDNVLAFISTAFHCQSINYLFVYHMDNSLKANSIPFFHRILEIY